MARRQTIAAGQIRRVLQDAPQLRSFIIPNVRLIGRQLGGGSYGTVEELEIDGLVCAGKKLYDALIDPENQGAQRMVDKYYDECRLLSDLRHPNIVQFLGICFLPDSRLPVLVMERLQGSLDELLENTADISLSTKVSILQDVARGLVYLHNRIPSVIHRDLSARNILLNSAMTAKIADLGNSRIGNNLPAQTMTRGVPGTLVYMPPEALSSHPRYGPPLDMFSFGHLTLFTAIQVFPKDLLTPTYHNPRTNRVRGRSELERRGKYVDVLYERFDKRHPLVVLVKGCLEHKPGKRPTARQALEWLEKVRATVRDPYSDLNRLQLEKSLTEKEAEVQQIPQLKCELEQLSYECATLNGRLEKKTVEMEGLQAHNRTLQEEKAAKDREIAAILAARDEQLRTKEREIAAKESEISEKDRGLISLQQRCGSLQTQLETVQRRNQSPEAGQSASGDLLAVKDAHIAALQTELRGKDRILQAKAKTPQLPNVLTFNLPLKWKKPIKMPSGVSHAQAVAIGEKVYIGGGYAERYDRKVLEYTAHRGQWREIATPVKQFGMAAVNKQLVITGGWGPSNEVWALDSVSGGWVRPFPAVPTARYCPSAVGYKRWVLVVGGRDERCVEVLDTESKQWYRATSLPSDAYRPSLTVIQDTLYVVWGCSVVSTSIPMLISDAMSQSPASDTSNGPKPTEWHSLPDTPTVWPTITTFYGSLIAAGGVPASSTIAMYLPQTEQWLKVAELPTPRCRCTCALLPETEELMVIGGQNQGFIKSIDLCTL